MNQRYLGKIDQLVGFSYYSFKDQKFRRFHPTDIIKGAIISSNSDDTLKDLIYPYSFEELENALKKSGRKKVLNSKVIEVMPCDNIRFSKEYGGAVGSMSFKEIPIHSVKIRNAHRFDEFELYCSCEKFHKRRFISGVFSPAILSDWNLKEKRYSETTCPHICSTDFSLRKIANINPLGLDDGLEFTKPYVLSFIDVIEEFPKLPDYAIDFGYAYESSMFDRAKKQVNEMRRKEGLEEVKMYSNPYLKKYIRGMMGIGEETMKRVVEIVGY